MSSSATLGKLNKIFCDIFDDDQIVISEDMTANDIEEWDSLNHINIVVAVEKKFNIKFTTKEIMIYENVGQFANAVEEKLATAGTKGNL